MLILGQMFISRALFVRPAVGDEATRRLGTNYCLVGQGSSSIASETSLLLLSSIENYPERKLLSVEIRDLTVSLLCVYIKSGTMIIPLGMRSSLGHHL